MSDATNQETVDIANQILAELQQAARDGQLIENGYYATEADGRAAVVDGDTFKVVGSGTVAARLYRRVSSSASTLLAEFPSSQAIQVLQGLILSFDLLTEEVVISAVTDEEGGAHQIMTTLRTRDRVHEVRNGDDGIFDEEGGAPLLFQSGEAFIGPMHLRPASLPGVFVTNEEGEILKTLTDPGEAPAPAAKPGAFDAGGPYFLGDIVTAGKALHIDVASLLHARDRSDVGVTLYSKTTSAEQSSNQVLKVNAADYGPDAVLSMRDSVNPDARVNRPVKCVDIAQGAVTTPINVLVIGDSISNRQGPQFMQSMLSARGIPINWVGTMRSSGHPDLQYDTTGPLNEAREAWSTGNFVYSEPAEYCIPLAPGEESSYLAYTKLEQRNRNPFIRAAVAGDDPSIVRNGYVLDFANYQARFAAVGTTLATPDIVINLLGMNDLLRITDPATLYTTIVTNDQLLHSRLQAAWPGVKILRGCPGLPRTFARDQVWTQSLTQVIRAMRAASSGNGAVRFVPAWAFSDPASGYSLSAGSAVNDSGFVRSTLADITHPTGSNRTRLFESVAPYIPATHLGLI